MNILLIEDNPGIIKGLKFLFENNNYNFLYQATIHDAQDYIDNNHEIDLILLDITLPDGNGFDLYKETIKDKNIPTLFLTANDDEDMVVRGLNLGGEDYITKPFSTKELLARCNRILLRSKKQSIIKVQDIKFDMDKMIVYKNDQKLDLTFLELKLLNLLFINLNKVVTRNTMLDKIWEWTGNYIDDHTITVYFKRIREKLQSNIIITIKGIGYRIDDEK